MMWGPELDVPFIEFGYNDIVNVAKSDVFRRKIIGFDHAVSLFLVDFEIPNPTTTTERSGIVLSSRDP